MDLSAAGLCAATGYGLPAGVPPSPAPAPAPAAGGSLCMSCEVRLRCLGGIAAEAGTAQLQGILAGRQALGVREVLYRPGESLGHVYAVRRGTLKSTVRGDDGERVRGFHFPGELVGVDGLAGGQRLATVSALEDTQLCALRLAPQAANAPGAKAFLARLWDMMSCELVRERAHQTLLATLPPPQRVAAFLASLGGRMRGRRAGRWPVPLTGEDVASYLRVAPETVAAVLAEGQR